MEEGRTNIAGVQGASQTDHGQITFILDEMRNDPAFVLLYRIEIVYRLSWNVLNYSKCLLSDPYRIRLLAFELGNV